MKNYKNKKILIAAGILILIVTITTALLSLVFAQSSNYDKFPIGVFNSPSPENTNDGTYKTIKDMNASYVLMGNGVDDFAENDAAITHAAANGLKVFVEDRRLTYLDYIIPQNSSVMGYYVTNTNPVGQTFKAPTGTDCILNNIQLKINNSLWSSAVTLKLSIYSNVSKSTLLFEKSITGPVGSLTPTFTFNARFTSGSTYYCELTSNSSSQIFVYAGAIPSDNYTDGAAYQNGSIMSNDLWFNINYRLGYYDNGTTVTDSDIVDVANHYNSNPNVVGYNLKDEPIAYMFAPLFETVKRFRNLSPNKKTYVNLMPNYYTGTGINDNYGMGQYQYSTVSANNAIGQSFRTNSSTNYISTIKLKIDDGSWSLDEGLTLKIWDSPSKTNLIATSNTLIGATNKFASIFTLRKSVLPNTDYYWEIIHNGGGDNAVNIVRSISANSGWENYGTAYITGLAQTFDYWFTVNDALDAFSYNDYIDRWTRLEPDFLMFDYYPFLSNNTLSANYYKNLEIIRQYSLKYNVPFQSYIQSCGITGWLRVPNANEMRYQIYTNLAYGCKGYNYFLYWTPAPSLNITNGLIHENGTINTGSYNAARDINAEVLNLGPILQTLTSQEIYHCGYLENSVRQMPTSFFFKPENTALPVLIGYFKDENDRKYIMAVNRDYVNSRNITFDLPKNVNSVLEISKIDGSMISTNYSNITGKVTSSFAPGEGRLYALPVGY